MSEYHLGVATRVLGAPLRSHDSRRWQQQPHLSVSLAYLRDLLTYLHGQEIRFYRLSSQLAPYATHPDLPQFHRQIDECSLELAALGDLARSFGVRLTMHPPLYLQLGSDDGEQARRAAFDVEMAARLLEAMGLGSDSVLVIHAGHALGDPQRLLSTLARRIDGLPAPLRARLALEHDDRSIDLHDALWLHRRTGVPVVFDVLHHRCLNRRGTPLVEGLSLALNTWPAAQRPKIHLSTSRTEVRTARRGGQSHLLPPLPNQHSDFINPFECIDLLNSARAAHTVPFDIMVEAKACELAVLRLRQQVAVYAPALAALVG
jgi:UV DNA damage endonuclease